MSETKQLLEIIQAIRDELAKGTQGEFISYREYGEVTTQGGATMVADCRCLNGLSLKESYRNAHNIAASLNALPLMLDAAEQLLKRAKTSREMCYEATYTAIEDSVSAMIRPYAERYGVDNAI